MNKISKNIKQFRSDCSLTQDALAEMLSVSRQTVSSWETDRTQPDIEMLSALSHALGVSEEEMIYGKKNKVGLEPEVKPNRNVFFIVLTVFGTLLTVAGLIMLFAEFWDKLAFAKNFFALLPLLAGFGLALFAMTKRKTSVIWREASGVAWTVGMAATNLLLDSLNANDIGLSTLFLISALLCLPILIITKAVFPFGAYLYGITHALTDFRYQGSAVWDGVFILVNAVLLAVAYIWYKKNMGNRVRDTVYFWILLAAGVFTVVSAFYTFGSPWQKTDDILFFAITGTAIGLYALAPSFRPQPVDKPSAVALCVMSLIGILDPFSHHFRKDTFFAGLTGVILALAITVVLIKLPKLLKEPLSLGAVGLCITQFAVNFACCFSSENPAVINALLAALLGIVFIIKGVTTAKLSTANLGMLTTGAVVVLLLAGSELPALAIGIVITLCGIILLVVNKLMYKKFSEKKEGAVENG